MFDVFNLAAKLTLDSSAYDDGLKKSKEDAESFGSKLKSGLATAGKAAVAGIAAAGTAIGGLVKQAVEGYASYEQLVGGVDTLFGRSEGTIVEYARSMGKTVGEVSKEWHEMNAGADAVMRNAAQAFKTAGLSANEYMETVTSFSASLIQSVGGDTKKAADYADMAIRDMSDNANNMGSDMSSIQTAYQGFAKQNYTMLDNLKLGYGGTKTEMERLVKDAEKLNTSFKAQRDENGDLALSYADIVDAIHIVQDNLGITGTTAREASATIEGSVKAMKSAWQNLVTGMADEDADIGELVSLFAESVSTAAGNVIPRVQQALEGIGQVIESLAPVIVDAVPPLISKVLPPLLTTAASLLMSIGNAIIDALPTLIPVAVDIIMTLTEGLIKNLPELLRAALDIIVALAQGIVDSLPEMIPAIIDVVLQIVDTLTDPTTLGLLVDATIAIIVALASGLIDALPRLLDKAPEIVLNLVNALIENAPKLFEAALEIVLSLVKSLIDLMPRIFEVGGEIIGSIVQGIVQVLNRMDEVGEEVINNFVEAMSEWDPLQWGKDLVSNLIDGIKRGWENLKSGVSDVAQGIKNFLGFSEPKEGPLSDFHTYAPDMMALFAKGIRDNEDLIFDQIEKSFNFGDITIGNAKINGGIAEMPQTRGYTLGRQAENREIVVNETIELDGSVLARKLYRYNMAELDRHGTELVQFAR